MRVSKNHAADCGIYYISFINFSNTTSHWHLGLRMRIDLQFVTHDFQAAIQMHTGPKCFD